MFIDTVPPVIAVNNDKTYGSDSAALFRKDMSGSAVNDNYALGMLATVQLNRNYNDSSAFVSDLIDTDVVALNKRLIVCGMSKIRVDMPTDPGWFFQVTYQVGLYACVCVSTLHSVSTLHQGMCSAACFEHVAGPHSS